METTGPGHSGGSHQTDKGKVLYIKTYPNPYKTKKSFCTCNIFIMKNIGMQQGFHFVSQILKQCCLNDVLLQWGSNKHLLAVNTIANVFMLNEQVMSAGFKEQVSVKNV